MHVYIKHIDFPVKIKAKGYTLTFPSQKLFQSLPLKGNCILGNTLGRTEGQELTVTLSEGTKGKLENERTRCP